MSIADDVTAMPTFLALLLGIPVVVGAFILLLPLIIIAGLTQADPVAVVKGVSVFVVAILLIRLFSKYQIIENGICGIILGVVLYNHSGLHPVFCILAGIGGVIALFVLSELKVFYLVKTGIFSIINTLLIYCIIYSQDGLYPAQDTIWAVTFFIVFLLENLFIRCTTYAQHFDFGYKDKGEKKRCNDPNKEQVKDDTSNQKEYTYYSDQNSFAQSKENRETIKWFSGITNGEELKKRYHDLMKIYHPDNNAGDVSTSQQIKNEYDILCKKYAQNGQ